MRAILDPNVLISALLAPDGSPAKVLRSGLDGAYDPVAWPLLLAERSELLISPKIRRRIPASDATSAVRLVEGQARVVDDPTAPPLVWSPDPGDDYLVALAVEARAVLVSGARDLLGLEQTWPIHSPAAFLTLLGDGS